MGGAVFPGSDVAHAVGHVHCMISETLEKSGHEGHLDGRRKAQFGFNDLGNECNMKFVEFVVEVPELTDFGWISRDVGLGRSAPEHYANASHSVHESAQSRREFGAKTTKGPIGNVLDEVTASFKLRNDTEHREEVPHVCRRRRCEGELTLHKTFDVVVERIDKALASEHARRRVKVTR